MEDKHSADLIRRVASALEVNKAIKYDDGCPDKEYPEIVWHTFGIFDSNEIAVIAHCGELKIGMASPSTLLHPPMADRIFGIDMSDRQLSFQIADQIWSRHGAELEIMALAIRDKSHSAK